MTALLLLAAAARAAGLPEMDELFGQRHPPDATEFGMDVSAGPALGSLLGSWPDPGLHGAVLARYDAFVRSRRQPGWRLGASFWGATALWPLQWADETSSDAQLVGGSGGRFRFSYVEYGVIAAIRGDPEAAVSPAAGIGFGELDLVDYYGGPLSVPVLVFEGGLRQRLPQHLFLDWLVRVEHGQSRPAAGRGDLEEWWLLQFLVLPGWHGR